MDIEEELNMVLKIIIDWHAVVRTTVQSINQSGNGMID